MRQNSVRHVAIGTLVAAAMLLGSFQLPHRHVHTAIRARGHACTQASLTQPVFSLDSSDSRDGDLQVAAQAPVSLPDRVAPAVDVLRLVSKTQLTGVVPITVHRLKLPPPSNTDSPVSL